MDSKSRHLTRLTAVVATLVGTVFLTAGQALAMRPDPGPTPSSGASDGSGTQTVLRVTDSSVSIGQWVLFAVVVAAALLIGAALTHLAQRRRTQLAH
jgi:hypothetical protein